MRIRGICSAGIRAAIAAGFIALAGGPALAQQGIDIGGAHLDLQNAIETDWSLSTAAKNNQFNDNAGYKGSGQKASTDGNTLNLAAFRLDTLANMRLSSSQAEAFGLDNVEAFVHGRFWSDITTFIDGHIPHVNMENNAQHYPGNGWQSAVFEKEYLLDAAEAYSDLRKGPLWLRLGKQQIVYGQEVGFQTLDQVDSLDLRRHSLFNYSGLEYSDARIATWSGRLTYDLGDALADYTKMTSTRLTSWVSEFQPSVFLPAGSPYNTGFYAYQPLVAGNGEARARHKLSYGGVIETNVLGVDLSANFYSHPASWGTLGLQGFGVDPRVGAGPNQIFPGSPAGLVEILNRKYPRVFIYGGMASYMIQPIYEFPGADIINGDLVRVSGTYTPNKAYLNTTKRVGEINMALDIEKNWRWTAALPSLYVLLEYNYRSRSNVFDQYLHLATNDDFRNFNLWYLDISQPLPMSRWQFVNFFGVEANQGGSYFYQPAVIFKPTSAQEYQVFWNFASGGNDSNYGGSRFSDEIVARLIYKF